MSVKLDGDAPTGNAEISLLQIVKGERERSIGFDLDPELLADRIKALEYSKGKMVDMPVRKGRSPAISTDLADAIETILPELVDIFVGGDDTVSFQATKPGGEEQAQQETDFLTSELFRKRNGFLVLHAFIKDALQVKTGIVKYVWTKAPEVPPEDFEGKTFAELLLAAQDGDIVNLTFDGKPIKDAADIPPEAQSEPLFAFSIPKEGPDGHVESNPVTPEDFTVARDTVWLKDATYCAERSRPRAQELIDQGHPRDIINSLPGYGIDVDERIRLARDTAGEHLFTTGEAGPNYDLRIVEVVDHYVRILNKAGKLEIWRVFTGGDESILIHKEKVNRIPYAVMTPFIVTHRFYGESLYDKLGEIQRIKTSLLRMALDNGYFSLNQRQEVDMSKVNEFTLSDLVDNRPGHPVRVKASGALNPLQSAGAPYDYAAMLEYVSTMAESRTGIVRNAQGLNPDTLHDTAGGAAMLLSEAQKRIRFIARIFAETGIKDWYLGAHALMREHATQKIETQISGKWVTVDPTTWGEQNDMVVEIGVGAGGRGQKLAALTQIITDQNEIAGQPGGQQYVTPANRYRARMDAARAAGLKSAEQYYTDPSTVQPPQPSPPPELLKLQADQQSDQARNQVELQKASMASDNDQRKLLADHTRQMAEIQSKHELERMKLEAEERERARQHELAITKLHVDAGLKNKDIDTRSKTQLEVADIRAETDNRKTAASLMVQGSQSEDVSIQAGADRDHQQRSEQADRQHQLGVAALDHLATHDQQERARAHEVHMRDTAPEPSVEKPEGDE